jgi:hypothetical protein
MEENRRNSEHFPGSFENQYGHTGKQWQPEGLGETEVNTFFPVIIVVGRNRHPQLLITTFSFRLAMEEKNGVFIDFVIKNHGGSRRGRQHDDHLLYIFNK